MAKDDANGLVTFRWARLVGAMAAALRDERLPPHPAAGGCDGC
jgi:hypothetical protein